MFEKCGGDMMKTLMIFAGLFLFAGCEPLVDDLTDQGAVDVVGEQDVEEPAFAVATVAGGCFWGIEDSMKKVDGVIDTDVGYCGGTVQDVTYEMVLTGNTGHTESVRVLYDPSVITYERLIAHFLMTHNPTVVHPLTGYGSNYRSAVFYLTEAERDAALVAIHALDKSGKWDDPIVTEVVPATTFWMAEEYHQDYYEK
jgi:methionine-S-sulfoxide reductase